MATRSRDRADEGRDFFRRLSDEGARASVYLVYGEERFLVDEAVRRLVTAVFPSGRDDFNFASYHGSEASGADIVAAASQVPMFGPRRVVVARGIDQLRPAELETVVAYAEAPYDTSVLVLEAVKLDGRQGAVKRLTKASTVVSVEFSRLYEREAADWVRRQASRRGMTIDTDTAAYLVDALGTPLGPLDMALERLSLFIGEGGAATLQAAMEIVPDTRARTVFELTDHLAARRFGEAVACFDRMTDQGESPIGALAMIARHFRQLVMARDAVARGLPEREMASRIGCPPFRVRDYVSGARAFSDERLRTLLSAIAETDLQLKSSRLRRELLVERLFLRICVAPG